MYSRTLRYNEESSRLTFLFTEMYEQVKRCENSGPNSRLVLALHFRHFQFQLFRFIAHLRYVYRVRLWIVNVPKLLFWSQYECKGAIKLDATALLWFFPNFYLYDFKSSFYNVAINLSCVVKCLTEPYIFYDRIRCTNMLGFKKNGDCPSEKWKAIARNFKLLVIMCGLYSKQLMTL